MTHSAQITKSSLMQLGKSVLTTALLGSAILLNQVAHATQADIDKEVSQYVAIFNGNDFQKQRQTLKKLAWSGTSSGEVYDVIAKKLLALKDADSKAAKEEGAWLAKGLGYSGNDKYRTTLTDVAANASAKKIRKYAEQGLASLDQYKTWNPIISANLASAPAGRLEEMRIANMLMANDPWLVRLGAKRVYHGHKTDVELVEKAAQRLKSEYPKAAKDNDAQIDALAWLIKVMAESGDKSHRPLLVEVSQKATVKKVKKYAKKYAAYLD